MKNDRLKLVLKLSAWNSFYEKCDELEENISKNDIISFDDTAIDDADITDKTYYFSDYVKKNQLQELNTKFTEVDSKRNETRYTSYLNNVNRKQKHEANKYKTAVAFFIIYVCLAPIAAFITIYPKFNLDKLISTIIIIAVGVLGILEVILFFRADRHYNKSKKESFKELNAYTDYKDYYIKNMTKEDNDRLEDVKNRYSMSLYDYRDFIVDSIQKLKDIKVILQSKLDLPKDYNNKENIKKYLSLILDDRADSLEEADKLLKEEESEKLVELAEECLNDNLNKLDDYLNHENVIVAEYKEAMSKLDSLDLNNKLLTIDDLVK